MGDGECEVEEPGDGARVAGEGMDGWVGGKEYFGPMDRKRVDNSKVNCGGTVDYLDRGERTNAVEIGR